MINIFYYVALGALGAVFGSFAGAQVWRLRASQLVADKKAGEPYDKSEYSQLKSLAGRKQRSDRSECLRCGHTLSWVDMIPIASWVALRGRCRYCNKPIGVMEIILEITTAVLFVLSLLLWPLPLDSMAQLAVFIAWLGIVVSLVILATYDYKWQLLPDVVNYIFIGLAAVFFVARMIIYTSQFDMWSALGAIGILSGVYAVLYIVSKGAWIGFGDVKLGIGLGLLLGDWKLAFFALFLANLIGCMIVLPGIIKRSLDGKSRIAFGPLLIVGTLISFWFGAYFIEWLFGQSLFFI